MFCNNCDKKEKVENIKRCLDLLSEEQRMVVLAYYYDKMSVKTIADTFGISEGAVKSRLYQARKRLMGFLKAEGENQKYKSFITYIPALITALSEILEENDDITSELITESYNNTCNELAKSS